MRSLMYALLLAALGCGACGGDGGSPHLLDAPSASDSAASTDAAANIGLQVRWLDDPPLPGPVSTAVTITSARFRVDRLEVIGDGGTPDETTAHGYPLAWTSGVEPLEIAFTTAPPAIYSKIRLSLDDADATPAFEIAGTVRIATDTFPFRATSREKVDLEITGYAVNLPIGGLASVSVAVDLGEMFDEVNWANLPREQGTIVLDDTASAMSDVRDNLTRTFTRPVL